VRKLLVFIVPFLVFALSANSAYAQANNASVGGVVQDSTKALIPGVTITLTNTNTGVVDTKLTNESGAYNFPSVPPGPYKISADLTGFRSAIQNNVQLGTAAQVRIDLTLQVGAAPGETVQVTLNADSRIQESAASVGDVLSDQRIHDLPIVGNNVLDLLSVLPGFRVGNSASLDTVGGMGLDSVNTTINGLSTNSSRDSAQFWGYQTFTTTVVNPDLVGEIRLILAPVDAELGRGNSQVQIQTRSGTNKYTGSAVWNVQNSALNANSWLNNHTPTTVNGIITSNSTKPDWQNLQQISASFGGPIIKNKTFFFFLYDQQFNNGRTLVSNPILTDTARQGIFRYWSGWNAGNAVAPFPTAFTNSTTAVYPSVDSSGAPVRPLQNPDGSAYTGALYCFSVFGNIKVDGSAFGPADCPGGNAVNHAPWDTLRPNSDTTGYIQKVLSLMPHADNFNTPTNGGDGLNSAVNRYVRGRKGAVTTNASIGVVQVPGDYNNRKQTNLKIDHNFNQNNRVSFGWTYEMVDSAGTQAAWDGGLGGTIRRRPEVLTVNGTSTISSNLVNEARFGVNYSSEWASPPWANLSNPDTDAAAKALLLSGGKNSSNGKTYPIIYNPTPTGASFSASGYMAFGSFDFANTSPLWDYADTIRWTHGKHAFSFGGEYRRPLTTGFNSSAYATSTPGNPAGVATPPLGTNTNFSVELPGFVNGTGAAGAPLGGRSNALNLTYMLNGSLATASTPFWIDNFNDVQKGFWQDTTTEKDLIHTGNPDYGHQQRSQISNEWSFFAKDDFKIAKRLTLNLGLRWDENFSPYLRGGLTNKFAGDGVGLYGAGRPAGNIATNADLLKNWLQPGNLYISGYGSLTSTPGATPLTCVSGVQQTPNLPVSTCDPALMSTVEFVGPSSPNPKETLVPQNGQFSPAIGFAWQVPWFGEGKTTMRGGFQRTYGGAGSNFSGGIVSGYGGDSQAQGIILTDPKIAAILTTRALNLTDLPNIIPTPPVRAPGVQIPIANRISGGQAGGYAMYAPDYKTPFTDNFTLSITRNIGQKYTVDVRFVDTIGKKLPGTIGGGVGAAGSFNLNLVNVYHNPELFNALEVTRAGGDDPLFDQMLQGLNIVPAATSAAYGPVGTTVGGVLQRGSAQIRRQFATSLANGDYSTVVTSLLNTTITTGAGGAQALPIDPTTGIAYSGAAQRILRNGCDRIANGLTAGFAIPGGSVTPRCFPENYILANPQLTQAVYATNYGKTNYQSGQLQFTARPIQGVSVQGTYSFSKTMSHPGSGFTDPLNPQFDYGVSGNSVGQEFRSNGTFELPMGPNKILFGNSSGWIARAIEHWQTSFIYTLPTGALTSMVTNNMLYANGRPDVVGPWDNPRGDVSWQGVNGSYFGSPTPYISFADPQCASRVGATDANGFSLQANCTLTGLAQIVPAGTPGSIVSNGQTVLPLLQNPLPGKRGTLSSNTMHTVSHWTLDANVSKSFRISESKALQLRIDTTNIMNHPTPSNPTGVGSAGNSLVDNFGQITAKCGLNPSNSFGTCYGSNRTFQGQLRFTF
jgi:hypothetical protein